jgi:hypothetical protein
VRLAFPGKIDTYEKPICVFRHCIVVTLEQHLASGGCAKYPGLPTDKGTGVSKAGSVQEMTPSSDNADLNHKKSTMYMGNLDKLV